MTLGNLASNLEVDGTQDMLLSSSPSQNSPNSQTIEEARSDRLVEQLQACSSSEIGHADDGNVAATLDHNEKPSPPVIEPEKNRGKGLETAIYILLAIGATMFLGKHPIAEKTNRIIVRDLTTLQCLLSCQLAWIVLTLAVVTNRGVEDLYLHH
jgi:hypothetical protein